MKEEKAKLWGMCIGIVWNVLSQGMLLAAIVKYLFGGS